MLGTLFYRFISENLTDYINRLQQEAGVEGFDYADMDDGEATPAKDQIVQGKEFFILPSQLFINVCRRCEHDENLNMTLSKKFRDIEGSAIGTESEDDMKAPTGSALLLTSPTWFARRQNPESSAWDTTKPQRIINSNDC